ncbi:MAG: 50S ribosomal protein L22 [Elusimicrobia bacterium]|nr:50S ribosomal protein L22 [Elusimicrobiota bacterium]
MESTARARFQRFGSRKMNQILGQIRGKTVERAEQILPMVPRIAAGVVAKTVHSAAANLSSRLGHKVDSKNLWVKSAWVGQGPMQQLKRIQPGPMGRAHPFKRKMCHLTVVVSDGKGV